MKKQDRLSHFVRQGLEHGKSRAEIAQALEESGWAPNEIASALDAWADSNFDIPVPRPTPYVSAREFFFYGLMFAALAVTAWHLVSLSFNLIDTWLPEIGEGDWRSSYRLREMRFSIASLVVFGPLLIVLASRSARVSRDDPGLRRSAVRKWLGYLTLFVAALALLGDVIWVIYSLLNGDLTGRVALKALVIAVVAGAIFLFFRQETLRDDQP